MVHKATYSLVTDHDLVLSFHVCWEWLFSALGAPPYGASRAFYITQTWWWSPHKCVVEKAPRAPRGHAPVVSSSNNFPFCFPSWQNFDFISWVLIGVIWLIFSRLETRSSYCYNIFVYYDGQLIRRLLWCVSSSNGASFLQKAIEEFEVIEAVRY